MFKQCKVVMLSSNQKSNLILIGDWKRLHRDEHDNITELSKDESFQHLYVVSDEEIKEGDWVINSNTNSIAQYTGHGSMEWWKKIIATTDDLLIFHIIPIKGIIEEIKSLPKLPQSFIDKYISEYNESNVITDVMVEYESFCRTKLDGSKIDCGDIRLKINPDNTINIQQIKDSYTREEVMKLCEDAFHEGSYNTDSTGHCDLIHYYNWIEQNL